MHYPGRLIKSGEQDARIVKALKGQLNRVLALQGRNAIRLDPDNPVFKTACCLAHWNGAPSMGARRLTRSQAVADPARVQPGMVFIMDFGGGAGHTGLVESVAGGHMATLEGNTDASKTREGGGVYRLTRKLADVNKGFIDYSGL